MTNLTPLICRICGWVSTEPDGKHVCRKASIVIKDWKPSDVEKLDEVLKRYFPEKTAP